MKKQLISLCLLVCGLININARHVSLINATVDKKGENVIITYDLDETSNIEMFFSPTGKDDDYRQIWKSEVSGACGENVGKGSKKVTWKALKNYGCIITSEGRIKIIASKSELAENFKNSPMGQIVNSFQSSSNKSTSSSDKYEAISKPLTLCVLGKEQSQEPQYNLRIICSSFLNSKDNIVYIGYEYQSNYSTKGVVPKLDLSMIQPDGSIEVIYSGPAQCKFEIPKNLFQDGTTKLTATMHDPRKTITAEEVVRTRQNMLSFKGLQKSEYELSKFVELKTITVKKKYKWMTLTKNFDKNTIIRGIRINVTHPSDNNLYFSSKPGIDLAGKNAESCKTEEQGYAYYSMVNTGIQSPDGKYTGLISYLPRHNYERPFANGYDEWTGIGLNMPITRQQKKDDNRYELYFIENEVYWAGAEKKDVEIDGIEVYVYEKDATEAELAKLVNAHLKEQEKIRKERIEKTAQLESQVIGRWSYEDRYGGVTFVFWAGGQFDFCAYGHKTRGSYSVWQNGEIHIRCSGENIVTYMESANKMRIIEGGNGEVYTKISDQPYQP